MNRYERELDVKEPKTIRVEGLYAIKDKKTGEVRSHCASEVHARVVAAHATHFEVAFVSGPFELLDGMPVRPEPVPEGRFRRIVEGD